MYDKRLDSVICAAECGSFNKAAQEIGYSVPALLKQINGFERELGITIFDRSNKGVSLTPNGRLFIDDAKGIVAQCEKAVERARGRQDMSENLVRVGVSLYQSGQRILSLCQNLYLRHTDLVIQFVPVGDTYDAYKQVIGHLGEDIDVFCSTRLEEVDERLCNLEIIGNPYLCLAVPIQDALAEKDVIDVSELRGRRIHIQQKGNPYIDSAREEIEKGAADVEFIEFPHYSIGVFDECSMSGDILLSKEIWRDVHPLLKTIDVRWNVTMPYCLYYAKEPRPAVLKFVEELKALSVD